jgi:hypothetical protein
LRETREDLHRRITGGDDLIEQCEAQLGGGVQLGYRLFAIAERERLHLLIGKARRERDLRRQRLVRARRGRGSREIRARRRHSGRVDRDRFGARDRDASD